VFCVFGSVRLFSVWHNATVVASNNALGQSGVVVDGGLVSSGCAGNDDCLAVATLSV
jgi:hypothetical protein